MASSILSFHSILRYAVLLIVPICAIIAFMSWKKKAAYKKSHEVLARINIGINHLQMLIGIIFMTHSTNVSTSNQNHQTIIWTYVHPALMMLSIVFVTLALMAVRNKKEDAQKHYLTFVFNTLAAIFLLIGLIVSGRGIV
jgi:hypothetical protein